VSGREDRCSHGSGARAREVLDVLDEAGRVERLDHARVGGALRAAALKNEGGDLLALLELSDGARAAATGQLLSSSCFSCLSLALVMLNDEFLWISDRRQRLVMAQSHETQRTQS